MATEEPISTIARIANNWRTVIGIVIGLVTFGGIAYASYSKMATKEDLRPIQETVQSHTEELSGLRQFMQDMRDTLMDSNQQLLEEIRRNHRK